MDKLNTEMKTYVIFIRTAEPPNKSIKIKATGHTVHSDGKRVDFEENGNLIAVFNMAELVGFVESDHIVN